MKQIAFLLLVLFISSCARDDDFRSERPGIATSINGNVKDYHRDIDIEHFEVQLIKQWRCSDGGVFATHTCEKVIGKAYTDANGNYTLDFEYNLRSDESYKLRFNEVQDNAYSVEIVDQNGAFTNDYSIFEIIEGEQNSINLNAWVPVKVKINLTTLNNHTPPLITGIEYNGGVDFATNFTYPGEEYEEFELRARPNCDVEIKSWYIENRTTSNPIFHFAPAIPYSIGDTDSEITFEVDCNTF
ncbi:hypothetical protein AM493_16195 [Flavobacterium akiainvivens]|uniref:DUF3823 domain-containing protein n=1 Tax=Flavobacterium akiainvivens TaxID=1202724 RepID=A0A0M9VJF2_9FLAO|nr:hypothetical protein [Flavobacterium akiainvivens]KOS07409.1 hypothetical protein AM493_16195 [Flavobacterium akiainvivens]SFQ47799.1 hypothetical protein SAMN05444144_105220 [Flavobacterium akiainvivens]